MSGSDRVAGAKLNRKGDDALLWLALGIALVFRLAALALAGDISQGARLWEYGEQAACAYQGGGDLCLHYPNGGAAYPSAYMPPLLSYLWLALFHLVGDGAAARAIWLGASLAAGLANVWMVFRLAQALARSRLAAFLAALTLAVYPTFVMVTATYHQTNWAVFFLLAIALVAIRIATAERPRLADAALGGLLCGLATLNRSEMLLIGPAVIALAAFWRWDVGAVLRVGAAAALAMAVVLSPWVIRNFVVFGHVIPAAQSTGYNLWKGYNPYTNGSGNMSEEPAGGPGDQARWRIRDQVAPGPGYETRLQEAYKEAFESYVSQASPGRLVELAANKVVLLWGFDWTDRRITGQLAYLLPWVGANLLVLAGLFVVWRDRRSTPGGAVMVCLATLGLLTAAYAATAVHARYRMHIEPFLFVFAGSGAEALLLWIAARLGIRNVRGSTSKLEDATRAS